MQEEVAVKFQLIQPSNSGTDLKYEYGIFEKLDAVKDKKCEEYGIPFVYFYGIVDKYEVFIMTLLDANIESLYEHCEKEGRMIPIKTQLEIFRSGVCMIIEN